MIKWGIMVKSDKYAKLWEKDSDKLGTNSFAEELGKFILNYRDTDSLVIGLCGEWGSGKTSIIKSTLYYIEKEQEVPYDTTFGMLINYFNRIFRKDKAYDYIDDDYLIIEFNPWKFSNQDQLISQFFKEMIIKLEKTDYDNLKKTAQKLEVYANFFESIGTIFPPIKALSRSIKNSIVSIKDYSNNKLNDLYEIKEELNDILKNQNHKIVIFIDDIDRLNKNEIRQIFQLVKLLADFPNTIYILAFDKKIVVNSLKNAQKDIEIDSMSNIRDQDGLKYLEKIIQVIYEVPKISRKDIKILLDEELKNFKKHERWDEEQWSYYQRIGIKYFFKNIRDINRYYNTLLFNFEMLKDEVNLPDLFAITSFQVFIPEVYDAIKNNKDIFGGDLEYILSLMGTEQNKAEYKDFIEKTINKGNHKISEDNLMKLLKSMFPRVVDICGDDKYPDFPCKNDLRRICKLDMFDTYFRFSVPKWELSQKEFNDIINNANKIESFTNTLTDLIDDQRIYKFLELLQYSNLDIPKENIKAIIKAMINISDLFPSSNRRREREDEILYTIMHLGSSLDQKERFNTFKHAINVSESLYIPIYVVNSIDNFFGGAFEHPDFSTQQIKSLKKVCVDKIKIWAKNEKLISVQGILFILQCWAGWGEKNDVKKFTTSLNEKYSLRLIEISSSSRSIILDDAVNDFIRTMHNIMDLAILKNNLEKINANLEDNDKYKTFIEAVIKSLNESYLKSSNLGDSIENS